jgi:transposase InsO family protein
MELGQYCAERGVEHHLTAPYSSQQNGVVERRNQTMVAMARYLLKTKALLGYFWGEAIATTVHILNRSPTWAVFRKMPYEAWHGVPRVVHYMWTIGYIAHVKVTRPGLKKLDDRSRWTVFVSYEVSSKAYRCYDPAAQCVIVSRDVMFDEARQWRWESDNDELVAYGDPFIVEYTTEVVQALAPVAAMPPPSPILATPPVGEDVAQAPDDPELDDDALDADHGDAPLWL